MVISPNKWELDVQGYLNLCNITSATPRKQIRDFAAGVNDLGLWSSMVCWPLRSSQNAGTGTTAFSLGGLGAFNGTLVNGPTWGADGVDMNGLNRRITTSAFANQPNTIFSVQTMTSENIIQVIYDGNVRQHFYRNGTEGFGTGFAGSGASLNTFNADEMFTMQLDFNAASGSSSYNGGAKVTRNFGTNNLTNLRMGSPLNTQKGTLTAFIAVINASSVSLLHSLYKQTLGTGLGLP